MVKVKQVEVRATQLDHGFVTPCKEGAADQFSVYQGEPGAFVWVADFYDKLAACYWGRERAMRLGATFHNRIES